MDNTTGQTTNLQLRILLIPPMYGGSLPIARYCASALKELGHIVEVFESPAFHGTFTALGELRVGSEKLAVLENSFLGVVSRAITAKAASFEADLVLALAQAPLNSQALKQLRRDNIATAMWFVEDYALFTYWRTFAPLYDFFAVIQKEPFISELARIGQKQVVYLPAAADPAVHMPMELSPAEQQALGAEIAFVGAGYPNRRLAFKQLINYHFKIWGTEWGGDPVLGRFVQREGKRISTPDCVKIFNASTINLNLHSSVQPDTLVGSGDFVNPRTFELAACGAFQLTDQRALMAELFDTEELATFTSMQEFLEKIQYFQRNKEERLACAARARQRVLRDHTYVVRMQTLLEYLVSHRPDWLHKQQDQDAFFAGYPAPLREKIQELLQGFGLPAGTSFADLIWTIRQQQGRLGETETALLFLDEWQKQYAPKK